jgi:hypothetical protein
MTDHSKNDKTNRDLIEQNAKGVTFGDWRF